MKTTIPPAMQLESIRREEPGADAVYGPGGDENVILRVEPPGLRASKNL